MTEFQSLGSSPNCNRNPLACSHGGPCNQTRRERACDFSALGGLKWGNCIFWFGRAALKISLLRCHSRATSKAKPKGIWVAAKIRGDFWSWGGVGRRGCDPWEALAEAALASSFRE